MWARLKREGGVAKARSLDSANRCRRGAGGVAKEIPPTRANGPISVGVSGLWAWLKWKGGVAKARGVAIRHQPIVAGMELGVWPRTSRP